MEETAIHHVLILILQIDFSLSAQEKVSGREDGHTFGCVCEDVFREDWLSRDRQPTLSHRLEGLIKE